jgi:hypothetical protein
MIPFANIGEVMLKDEVLADVEAGKFHIYSVKTIDEGMEILTGVKAGELKDGEFEPGTVNHLVVQKLAEFHAILNEDLEGMSTEGEEEEKKKDGENESGEGGDKDPNKLPPASEQ